MSPAYVFIEQRGELLRLLVQDTAGREDVMDARLRPGWCLMQSATVVVAFAARPWAARPCWPILNTSARSPRCPAKARHVTTAPALAKIDQELRIIETLASQNWN